MFGSVVLNYAYVAALLRYYLQVNNPQFRFRHPELVSGSYLARRGKSKMLKQVQHDER